MRKLLNFYLYNNFHIALGALFFCYESYRYAKLEYNLGYLFFLFFGTIIIYSVHRYIGLKKIDSSSDRVLIIKNFRPIADAIIIISIVACAYVFFSLPPSMYLLLAIPVILSVLYVLPILPGKKRLRDLPYIKIFLIAIVWTILCCAIPLYGATEGVSLLLIERICFMLAITLPFDIRDINIDSRIGVKTIATKYGEAWTRSAALVVLAIGFLCIVAHIYFYQLESFLFVKYGIIYILTASLIAMSTSKRLDYHYTGYLDGTLIIRGLLFLI